MSAKIPVTVVVPVRNEEKNLPQCLERLSRFEALVVVDSNSTDSTLQVAARYGATVLQFDWNGRYPKKRNWMLENHSFTTPWVFFLDADEIVDERFCEAVERAVCSGTCEGYWINYANVFLGKTLRHGLPQRKLALFKVGSGLYERIEESAWSKLDMEIHEHPIIVGTLGEIVDPVEHRDFRGLSKFLEKHIEYAQWEARRLLRLEADASTSRDSLTPRQRFKYGNLRRGWYPYAYFIYVYFLRLGMLDGRAGFLYAFYKSWYFQSIQLLLKEYASDALGGAEISQPNPLSKTVIA
jgi:glycosyltransferase involved in cell wall biosynthesis